ncbi:hypothetical protein Salat_1474600 [Sesamum alatum]|uniref:Uncharacterized protein n=1 Tax=Sesamum alatum TaxID=300844 RepID=A0AAE1YBH2_9LAMI|nr:hypothetical protein Salat_1474600 [Sesamum alatum]
MSVPCTRLILMLEKSPIRWTFSKPRLISFEPVTWCDSFVKDVRLQYKCDYKIPGSLPCEDRGPTRDLGETSRGKDYKGKRKVGELSETEKSFPPIPDSQYSILREKLKLYEETLEEMRVIWIQSLGCTAESQGFEPVLPPCWDVPEDCYILRLRAGGPSLEIYKAMTLPQPKKS